MPSLGGLLSVGRYPQQFFPQLVVSVAVYPHVERGRGGPGGIRLHCWIDGGGNWQMIRSYA